MSIIIIGGTGNIGYGLALKLVSVGYQVTIGSRSEEKALAASERIKSLTGKTSVMGMTNQIAVNKGNLIILTIPNSARQTILTEIRPFLKEGKTIFDVTVPIAFNPIRYMPPKEGSNGMETKAFCEGTGDVNVVVGLHTVSASLLNMATRSQIDFDVLIAGDNDLSKNNIIEIFDNLGMRAVDVGGLEQATNLERLAVMLIEMNKRYKKNNIGIKLFGI